MDPTSERIKTPEEIKSYYNDPELLDRKLKDFVDGNERIECAWKTVESWAPVRPLRILEIACAIGAVCWRLSQRWPEAEVIGMDISEKSLEIARKLFGSRQILFPEGALKHGNPPGQFDLIILMDVYEHFARTERPFWHELLGELRSPTGRIVLSFPTPRHLAWLRANQPTEIQPIDMDVSIETISTLAKETKTEILLYQEVNVWREGDYAHAILGRQTDLRPVSPAHQSQRTGLIERLFVKGHRGSSRAERLRLVHDRLGKDAYPG